MESKENGANKINKKENRVDDGMNDKQHLEYLKLIKNIGKKGENNIIRTEDLEEQLGKHMILGEACWQNDYIYEIIKRLRELDKLKRRIKSGQTEK